MAVTQKTETQSDFKRPGTPAPGHTYTPSSKTSYDKVYIGIVKDVKDVQKMGRLRVFIPEFGGAPIDDTKWITVRYCSPFGGATSVLDNQKDGTKQGGSQISYGMWFVPPDLENEVIVMFINGEPNQGIWIGCLYQQYMNNMVPAIAASPSHDQGPKLDGKDINPPAAEYNKKDGEQNPNNPTRPRFDALHQGLYAQGLYGDCDRGPSNASARRESPSQVFGLNTPRGHHIFIDDGEIETEEGTGNPIYINNQIARKAKSNEYIRLRTRSGTQIIINDTFGYIYFNTRLGNSWFELSDEGINLYTAKNFNIRAQGNMNVRVDGNLNYEVLGTTQWHNGGDFIGLFDSDHHTSLPGGSLVVSTDGNIEIGSNTSVVVGASNDFIQKASRIVRAAKRIDHNSFGISGPAKAKGITRSAQMDRGMTSPGFPEGSIGNGGSALDERGFLTHEPWNFHQKSCQSNTSEDSVGNVTENCPTEDPNATQPAAPTGEEQPPAATNPNADQSEAAEVDPNATPKPESNQKMAEVEREEKEIAAEREKFNRDKAQLEQDIDNIGDSDEEEAAISERVNALGERNKALKAREAEVNAKRESVLKEVKQEEARNKTAQATTPTGSPATPSSGRVNSGSTNPPATGSGQSAGTPQPAPVSPVFVQPPANSVGPVLGAIGGVTSTFNPLAGINTISGRLYEGSMLQQAFEGSVVQSVVQGPTVAAARALEAAQGAAQAVASYGPNVPTTLPVTPNYSQDTQAGVIKLDNGAVIRDRLKDPADLTVSPEMVERIKAEYPFRDTITTIKDTGVQIIGYGTQVTADLAAQFQGGVQMAVGQAEELLMGRLSAVQDAVRGALKVPVTQNQFDSLVSLGEHIGPEAIAKSPVIENLNAGNVQGAVNSFNCYDNNGSLARRRRGEAATMANGGPGTPNEYPGDGVFPEPVEGARGLTHGRPDATTLDALDKAAERTGVSRDYLLGMAAQESAFNPNAKASTSSATGLMQFTDGTWNQMVNKYGAEYGLTADGRRDPYQSAMAGALYAKENQAYLQNKINRPLTPTDLYAAHFLGPGGAATLLRADGNAYAANVAKPNQVAANKTVFYNRDGSPRTVNEVYKWMQGKTEATGIAYGRAYPQGGATA